MIHRLGGFPQLEIIWGGLRFEVVDKDGQWIDKVLVSRASPDETTVGEGATDRLDSRPSRRRLLV